jgi:hypothetical protein
VKKKENENVKIRKWTKGKLSGSGSGEERNFED